MSAPQRSELAAAAAAFLRLGEERPPATMNLLQRKGRPDWRPPPREEEPRKGASKARDGGSLRRPLRVGFLTLPAPQERGPRPCAPGMAPRSLSCHAVGLPESGARPHGPRSGPPEGRLEAPPAKRGGAPRGGCVRQTPPLKPSRSPQTRLSAPPSTSEGGGAPEGEEPVYIEMVGDARQGGGAAGGGGPKRGVPPPPAPPEEPEAIYEEMSCPLPPGEDGGHAPFSRPAPFHGHTPFSGPAPPLPGHSPFPGHTPIPPPFPNLLTPRPPLLAAPPEGSRLPLPRREAPPPARARSHSTPLPPPPSSSLHQSAVGRERGGAGLGSLPHPPALPAATEAPPSGKRPPAYDIVRGGLATGSPALPRDEDPAPRRAGSAPYRRGKEAERTTEPPREDRGGAAPPPSGIPVRAEGFRGRPGPPLPCQTFPACGRPSDSPLGHRLGRSASTSGVRQAGAPPFPRGAPPPGGTCSAAPPRGRCPGGSRRAPPPPPARGTGASRR